MENRYVKICRSMPQFLWLRMTLLARFPKEGILPTMTPAQNDPKDTLEPVQWMARTVTS